MPERFLWFLPVIIGKARADGRTAYRGVGRCKFFIRRYVLSVRTSIMSETENHHSFFWKIAILVGLSALFIIFIISRR